MQRRRTSWIAAAAVIVLALAVGAWWWLTQHDDASSTRATASTGGSSRGTAPMARGATDPATGVPRWLAQGGVSRRIAGTVVDESGAPVRGATVRIASIYTNAGLLKPAPRTTDDAGRFDFGAQPGAEYTVTAEQKGMTGAMLQVDLRHPAPAPVPEQLRLVLHPCIAAIHGTIQDTSGGPIGGAMIRRAYDDIVTDMGAVADDHGAYELCVPPGGAEIVVSADGYARTHDTVDIYGRMRRDFALSPGIAVGGRVVRASDNTPVAGAVVELRARRYVEGHVSQRASSDDEGRFTFEAVAPGTHLISAVAERLATVDVVEIAVEVGTARTDLVVKVVDAFTVSGTVIERGSRKGVAGVRTWLVGNSRLASAGAYFEGVTRADGTFAIENVVPDEYRPSTERDTETDLPRVVVAASDVTGVVIEVDDAASIAGRVTHAGKPVEGARVRAVVSTDEEHIVFADHEGQFLIRSVPAGTFHVYAESDRVGAFASGVSVTLKAGEQRTGLELELDLEGSISGVVVDQNDAPVGGVYLAFSMLRRRDFGWATTAEDGTFTARSLAGGGEYVYEVRARDRSAVVFPPVGRKRHPTIVVKDGKTHVRNVRVKIQYERLAITGKFVDTRGKPVPDARVTATPEESDAWLPPSAMTDQNGGFTIANLPAGTYSLQATSARGDASLDRVQPGREVVVLRIAERGGIEGTVVGVAQPFKIEVVELTNDLYEGRDAQVTGATFKVVDAPPGEYIIRLVAGSIRATRQVTVNPGEVTKVTIKLGEVGTVVGTVIDEKTRAPVPGMSCMATSLSEDASDTTTDEATTDARGVFTLARVTAGRASVSCWGSGASTWKEIEVIARQTVRPQFVAERADDTPIAERSGASGMTLEDQLDDVYVSEVVPNGPAARAGVLVGDVLLEVDGKAMGRYHSELAMDLIESGAAERTLVLERDDKRVTVTLKLATP